MQRLAAMHLQRRRAVVLGIDPCAHLRQRAGDTAHRAAGQRLIADQRAVERLARQQAGQQAHAGAGIAAVQRCLRCFQAVDTHTMHDALRRAGGFDAHTQLAEDARGGAGVLAFEESLANLERGIDGEALGPEFLAEDLRLAARALERISGRIDVEEVLGAIFSRLCIGK